jgi:hypothetical protein
LRRVSLKRGAMRNCEELEYCLRLNPTDQSLYNELFDLLQNNESEEDHRDKIAQLREQYLVYFFPDEEFWLSWILDAVIDVNKKILLPKDVRVSSFAFFDLSTG